MSVLHDLIDWMGGFPYEFATYDLLVNYMELRGFELQKGCPNTSLGCHELVFKRINKNLDF
jgi:2-polyprenyl-6-hydroxyphenyl methylase/3-demethylubiquinone-9 3-methyltransferase